MSSRKITLRINEKDLIEVLQDLTELKAKRKFWNREEVQITLNLEDTRKTYEYLCKSKRILDWELGDSVSEAPVKIPQTYQEPEEEPEEIKEPEPKKPERKVEKFTDYVSKFSGSSDWHGLCLFIECSWRVAKKSPGVIFGTPLFKSSLTQELELVKDNASSERILLEKVLESYYIGVDYIDAVEDTIGKIRSAWKTLNKHESLTSVSIRLYKNT